MGQRLREGVTRGVGTDSLHDHRSSMEADIVLRAPRRQLPRIHRAPVQAFLSPRIESLPRGIRRSIPVALCTVCYAFVRLAGPFPNVQRCDTATGEAPVVCRQKGRHENRIAPFLVLWEMRVLFHRVMASCLQEKLHLFSTGGFPGNVRSSDGSRSYAQGSARARR